MTTPHAIIAIHAICNRELSRSQMRAIFAKQGGGGRAGGPVKPNLPKQPGGPKKGGPVGGPAPGPNQPVQPDLMWMRPYFPGGPSQKTQFLPIEGLPKKQIPENTTQPVPGYGTPEDQRGGPRTMDFRDKDKDGIDDRDQDGPGMPAYPRPDGKQPPTGGVKPPKLPGPPSDGDRYWLDGNAPLPVADLPKPRGYTDATYKFLSTPPTVGPDGYITGPNGKKYTPETYEREQAIMLRAQAAQAKQDKAIADGQKQQQNYGSKPAGSTPNKDLPKAPAEGSKPTEDEVRAFTFAMRESGDTKALMEFVKELEALGDQRLLNVYTKASMDYKKSSKGKQSKSKTSGSKPNKDLPKPTNNTRPPQPPTAPPPPKDRQGRDVPKRPNENKKPPTGPKSDRRDGK